MENGRFHLGDWLPFTVYDSGKLGVARSGDTATAFSRRPRQSVEYDTRRSFLFNQCYKNFFRLSTIIERLIKIKRSKVKRTAVPAELLFM